MFVPSQLVEISQRFQSAVQDLRVLLEEEGLPVGSSECLPELTTRLGSDSRFRRDVAFLVRSMLGREPEEPGSMDVLGVLVIAAGGTRQEFDDPYHRELIRELLRFVIQQRRPAADPALTPDAAAEDRRPASATPTSPRVATRREPPSPAPNVLLPDRAAVPSFARAEPEPTPRRVLTRRIAAVLAVLLVLGAGLLILRSPHATTRELATVPSAASPANPAVSEPGSRLELPRPVHSRQNSGRSLVRLKPADRRPTEAPQAPASVTMAANTQPKVVARVEPAQSGPKLIEPVNPGTGTPGRPNQASAGVSLPPDPARQRSAPGAVDLSKVFAHPDAGAASGSQIPPPVLRPKEPVLIARNTPAATLAKPEVQGTVRMGLTGTMASSLMYSPEPEYPARAIAAGVQGQVTVRAVVGPEGNVIDASIVSGPPLLREAALDAVGRWRYRPYEQDGKPTTIATTAILDFQLPPRNDAR